MGMRHGKNEYADPRPYTGNWRYWWESFSEDLPAKEMRLVTLTRPAAKKMREYKDIPKVLPLEFAACLTEIADACTPSSLHVFFPHNLNAIYYGTKKNALGDVVDIESVAYSPPDATLQSIVDFLWRLSRRDFGGLGQQCHNQVTNGNRTYWRYSEQLEKELIIRYRNDTPEQFRFHVVLDKEDKWRNPLGWLTWDQIKQRFDIVFHLEPQHIQEENIQRLQEIVLGLVQQKGYRALENSTHTEFYKRVTNATQE